jgi:hypothetical protein
VLPVQLQPVEVEAEVKRARRRRTPHLRGRSRDRAPEHPRHQDPRGGKPDQRQQSADPADSIQQYVTERESGSELIGIDGRTYVMDAPR